MLNALRSSEKPGRASRLAASNKVLGCTFELIVRSLRGQRLQYPLLNDAAWAALRALRSIVVVTAVALVVAVVRDGSIHWPKFARMVALNRTLFVAVFLGLFIWEFWYRRTGRHHTVR